MSPLLLTYCLFTDHGQRQWLKVTFASLAKVEKIQIFNRADEEISAKRIAGAEITLWNGDTYVQSCGNLSYSTTANLPSQSYLINCGSDKLADTVKIEQNITDYLNLMEVYVLTKTAPQHAPTCSQSEYSTGRTYMTCPISAGGLAVGDVISALVFYEHGEGFHLRLVGTQVKCFLLQLRYREAKGWTTNKKDGRVRQIRREAYCLIKYFLQSKSQSRLIPTRSQLMERLFPPFHMKAISNRLKM